jgi:hypothetical protein
VAKALDFIHGQNYLHRDVKPDNILFDRFGNTFLSDFGIVKALASESRGARASAMTAPGFLMGTPGYVAPEIVMGHPAGARSDQYSLAMTVFEILTATNPMEGPTPSATLANQTQKVPPQLFEVIDNIPRRLSAAVARALLKRPEERFDGCVLFAAEVLADLPGRTASRDGTRAYMGMVSRGRAGSVTCPVCENPLAVRPELAGKGVRCKRCEATLRVDLIEPDTIELSVVGQPSVSWSATARVAGGSSKSRPEPKAGIRRWLAFSLLGLFLLACLLLVGRAGRPDGKRGGAKASVAAGGSAPAPVGASAKPVLNIAYGTEKKKWLLSALEAYAQTAAGRQVEIRLLGMGSLEGAHAVLDGPAAATNSHPPIHVWSPASSTYRDILERAWRSRRKGNPILSAKNLALTPMVFVMWKQRHEAFLSKYGAINFRVIGTAMREPGGWEGIAHRADWGLFKFGHTDPAKSNSGLQMLVLMSHEFAAKPKGLTPLDVTSNDFHRWLRSFERGVTRYASGLNHSTGDLMEEMVIRGPSQYDCMLVYENLAIDYMQAAGERWGVEGGLAVTYPDPNIGNEHPYYILDVPWSDAGQRKAAADFLTFLMSEPIQRRALEHGFRPGNPAVPVDGPDSPLVRHARQGIRVDLPAACEPPSADVVRSLLDSFRRLEP